MENIEVFFSFLTSVHIQNVIGLFLHWSIQKFVKRLRNFGYSLL